MSGYEPTHGPGGSGGSVSPFSNPSGEHPPGQGPSFKTNVHRQKTKRWVNAKSYSYDGDDWGDCGDEYDDEPEPAIPALPNQAAAVLPQNTQENRQETGDERPTLGNSGEQEPPSKQLPFIRPADIYKRMQEEKQKKINEHELEQKEADQSISPSQPQPQPIHDTSGDSPEAAVTPDQRDGASRMQKVPQNHNAQQVHDQNRELPIDTQESKSGSPEENASIREPDSSTARPGLQPVAGLPDSPMGASGLHDKENVQRIQENQEQQPASDASPLQHNTSIGFRSVVHQAFDAPPQTPSTPAGSILRSDSGSTSIISPIIKPNTSSVFENGRGVVADQTPTIAEEPAEFKPGHRRSMTPPYSGYAPARRTVVESDVHPAESQLGDLSEGPDGPSEASPAGVRGGLEPCLASPTKSDPSTPKSTTTPQPSVPESWPAVSEQNPQPTSSSGTESAYSNLSSARPDVIELSEAPPPSSPMVHDPHMPAALNVATDKRNSEIIVIAPSRENLSPPATEITSQDFNDRLRDEIIQSLTPRASMVIQEDVQSANAPGSSLEANAQTQHESTLIPSKCESFWNESGDTSSDITQPIQLHTASHSDIFPNSSGVETIPVAVSFPVPETGSSPVDQQSPASKLKKRFSWEEPSADGNEESQKLSINPATSEKSTQSPLDSSTPTGSERRSGDFDQQPDYSPNDPNGSETTPIQISTEQGPSSAQSDDVPSTYLASGDPSSSPMQTTSQPPGAEDHKLTTFRQIMAMTTTAEKVKAFQQTREKFAGMDTGLAAWIQATADSHPDHAGLVQRNGTLPPGTTLTHRNTIPRNKFPKLSSLGSISLQTSHLEGSPTTPGHTRRASGSQLAAKMHSQQVQAKGKDLLHSAGVLGGKAGGAAKGLFAKGRSKFRHNSGSTDKVNAHGAPTQPRPNSTPSFDGLQSVAGTVPDGQVSKLNPRLLSLKLDPSTFSSDMRTAWEAPRASPSSPKTEIAGPDCETLSESGKRVSYVSSSPPGSRSQKSVHNAASSETGGWESTSTGRDPYTARESDNDLKIDTPVETGNKPPSTPEIKRETANEEAHGEFQEDAGEETREDAYQEPQPLSPSIDGQNLLISAGLSTDRRGSSTNVSDDDSGSIGPPVEEARAIQVIGRKANVIQSELRAFSSRIIEVGRSWDSSTGRTPKLARVDVRGGSPASNERRGDPLSPRTTASAPVEGHGEPPALQTPKGASVEEDGESALPQLSKSDLTGGHGELLSLKTTLSAPVKGLGESQPQQPSKSALVEEHTELSHSPPTGTTGHEFSSSSQFPSPIAPTHENVVQNVQSHTAEGENVHTPRVISLRLEQNKDATRVVPSANLASAKVDENVQSVSTNADDISVSPRSPAPQSPTSNKAKALPSLPGLSRGSSVDVPEGHEPLDTTTISSRHSSRATVHDQTQPDTVKSVRAHDNIPDANAAAHPAAKPDSTTQHQFRKDQPWTNNSNGTLPAESSVQPPFLTRHPSQPSISPQERQADQQTIPITDSRSSVQLYRENLPRGNYLSKPATLQEEPRPGSAIAGFMSKAHFSRHAERRGSTTGQASERSRSSRFQSFRADSDNSKPRSVAGVESAPWKRAASDPNTGSLGNKMRFSTKFFLGHSRLSHMDDEPKKKKSRVGGLFSRHSKTADPPKTASNLSFAPNQYEVEITAGLQPQPHPSGHLNTMLQVHEQQQTIQPHILTNQGQQPDRLYQALGSKSIEPSAVGGNGHQVSQHGGLGSVAPQPPSTGQDTSPRRGSQPGNSQPYTGHLHVRSQSPMSFTQFQSGYGARTDGSVPLTRIGTTGIDPTQYPLPNFAAKSAVISPQAEVPQHPHPKNHNNSQLVDVRSTSLVQISNTRSSAPVNGTFSPNKHASFAPMLDFSTQMEPVELPVPGDDSSEEIVMSSTTYPGQEWQPEFYAD
ncbi:hypothetical protein PAAG_06684 [Paracoccidioides lutzii Pb01]|uniref:Uncharacterized protein n=1 Tax=Paracoccidioides lutzii (strain ATCC MYA-826 / Pb01) TaxID=502779 RepID=C1H7E3_PARBA|nr:hypothetical protein PAAG_06684 [Paracoccidioides lutzii Pb01]EEH35637.2 hypothetical protein PAAG_06684 [Paracoccidioides lutzii Pb01]